MKLDRHEQHVLGELEERNIVSTKKIVRLFGSHRLFAQYNKDGETTVCTLYLDGDEVSGGYALLSPKEKKASGAVGRMVAFARAIVLYVTEGQLGLDSSLVEKIARGIDE